MAGWFSIGKEIKDSINNKIGGITSGIMQAGGMYGNTGNVGFTPSTQQQNPAPVDTSNVSNGSGFMPQYGLNTANYQMPNTDFARRIMGNTGADEEAKRGLFQFLAR